MTDKPANPAMITLACIVVGSLIGAALVATRYIVDQVDPTALAALRYAIALLMLAPFVLMQRQRIAARHLLPISLLGIGQFGVLITLLNFSLLYIPAARAAVLFATVPLLTMLIATLLGRERLSLRRSLGVLACFAGVAIALSTKPLGAEAGTAWIGDLAAFGSALTGGVTNVLYGPYLRQYKTMPVSVLSMFAAVVALMIGALVEAGGLPDLGAVNFLGWSVVIFIGWASAVGFWLWLWALGQSKATNVAAFLSLSPIVATGLGIAVLSEPVTTAFLVGLALVSAGLWVTQRSD